MVVTPEGHLLDSFTRQEVFIARNLSDRKMQRALLQFFKPDNYFEVRKALLEAGRSDLVGAGRDCLIPANPPKEALAARIEKANQDLRGNHVHTVPGVKKGYRLGRKTAGRQQGRKDQRGK